MPKKTASKHEAIRADFTKLTKKKGLRSHVAIEQIATKLYLEETTIAAIVYQKGKYKVSEKVETPVQLNMF